jgi:hypothetical protein
MNHFIMLLVACNVSPKVTMEARLTELSSAVLVDFVGGVAAIGEEPDPFMRDAAIHRVVTQPGVVLTQAQGMELCELASSSYVKLDCQDNLTWGHLRDAINMQPDGDL